METLFYKQRFKHKQLTRKFAPGLGSNPRLNPCFLHKPKFKSPPGYQRIL